MFNVRIGLLPLGLIILLASSRPALKKKLSHVISSFRFVKKSSAVS